MKIYKFKDLRRENLHSHFFQILEENKVWCAAPSSLNDSSEFNFSMDYVPSQRTALLLSSMLQKLGTKTFSPYMTASYTILNNIIEDITKPEVEKIIEKCRNTIGVTSFSLSQNEPWLWETYGGQGVGAVVEFEIADSDLGEIYHLVDYRRQSVFHVDLFMESILGGAEEIFRKILCTKTLKWELEKEIRFLGKSPDVNITFDAPITKIIIGQDVPLPLIKIIEQRCTNKNIEFCFRN